MAIRIHSLTSMTKSNIAVKMSVGDFLGPTTWQSLSCSDSKKNKKFSSIKSKENIQEGRRWAMSRFQLSKPHRDPTLSGKESQRKTL